MLVDFSCWAIWDRYIRLFWFTNFHIQNKPRSFADFYCLVRWIPNPTVVRLVHKCATTRWAHTQTCIHETCWFQPSFVFRSFLPGLCTFLSCLLCLPLGRQWKEGSSNTSAYKERGDQVGSPKVEVSSFQEDLWEVISPFFFFWGLPNLI